MQYTRLPFVLRLLLLFAPFVALAQPDFVCGTSDRNLPDSLVRLMNMAPGAMKARLAAGDPYVCRIAVELDSDTYLAYDKDTNRLKETVLTQIALVSAIFEREINTRLSVVFININKDPATDPYAGERDIFKLFNRFETVWNSSFTAIPYDKRLYIYTKPVTGGASGLGSRGGKQAISFLGTFIVAHELGHTFNSPHTHSCSWAGGPLDYCSAIEGTCYSESLERTAGTLMSYCGDLFTFHPRCQVVMQTHAAAVLAKRSRPTAPPMLPAISTLAGSPFLAWAGVPMADRYAIEVADDSTFTQVVLRDTVGVSGYRVDALRPDRPYYFRLQALSAFGNSGWSGGSRIRFDASNPAGPRLLSPAENARFFGTGQPPVQLSVEPVAGATGYEVELTQAYDLGFNYPFSRQTVSVPFVTLPATGFGYNPVSWRARAVTGGGKGVWSATSRFLTQESYKLGLPAPANGLLPTRFPVYCGASSPQTTVRLTLSTQASFSSVVWTRTYTGNYSYVSMLDSLAPASTYYLKLEERNELQPNLPTGLINQVVQSFRTAAVPLSNRWSFVNGHTAAGYPPGGYINSSGLVFTSKGGWVKHSTGLVRIDADSLTVYQYDRATTGGKVGNLIDELTVDEQGDVRLTNKLSAANGSTNPSDQTVRLSGQDGRILSRTPFRSDQVIRFADPSQRIVVTFTGIYELTDGKLALLLAIPATTYVSTVASQANYFWVTTQDTKLQRSELIRITLDTKEIKTFNRENTPLLSQYSNGMVADRSGNLWVSQNARTSAEYGLVRFDGQNWTGFNLSNAPFGAVLSLTADRFGGIYVLANTSIVYKYTGAWQQSADLGADFNPLYVGTLGVDAQGKFWFSGRFDLMRYDPCPAMATPTLPTGSLTVNAGESVTLRAGGCTNAVWSWANAQESVADRLLTGTNQLTIKPESSTTYRVRCHADGCSGKASVVTVVIRPVLTLKQVDRRVLCPGETMQVIYGLRGEPAGGIAYRLTLRNAARTVTLVPTSRDSTLTVGLPTTLPAGVYWLNLESTLPGLQAADSIQVTVRPLPTAELSTSRSTLVPGDSAQIAVALTGLAPWQFTRWDGRAIQTDKSPYVATLKADQATTYTLTLTDLRDANCATGAVRNAVTVSALVLGVDPPATAGLLVYPNPTTGELTIDGTAVTAGIARLRLTDGQGREVNRRQAAARSHRETWDVSSLPAGSYILRIELTDGRQLNRTVVKQ